jgi:hypothetical protein
VLFNYAAVITVLPACLVLWERHIRYKCWQWPCCNQMRRQYSLDLDDADADHCTQKSLPIDGASGDDSLPLMPVPVRFLVVDATEDASTPPPPPPPPPPLVSSGLDDGVGGVGGGDGVSGVAGVGIESDDELVHHRDDNNGNNDNSDNDDNDTQQAAQWHDDAGAATAVSVSAKAKVSTTPTPTPTPTPSSAQYNAVERFFFDTWSPLLFKIRWPVFITFLAVWCYMAVNAIKLGRWCHRSCHVDLHSLHSARANLTSFQHATPFLQRR